MPPAFVQAKDGQAVSDTVSVAFAGPNAAGNLLVAWGFSLMSSSELSIEDSQGNAWIPAPDIDNVTWGGSGGTVSSAWYCLSAKAGANTVTLTSTVTNFVELAIAEYSGLAAFDQDAESTGFTRTAADSGDVTTTFPVELLVGLYATRGGTVDSFGGFTARINDTANGIYLADKVITSTETTSASDTLSSSVADIIGLMTFAGVGHSISGNAGTANANVGWSGDSLSGSVMADGSGNYTIPDLADGTYTLTPSLSGFTFSPATQDAVVSGSNVTGIDFTATPVPTPTGGTGFGGDRLRKPFGFGCGF